MTTYSYTVLDPNGPAYDETVPQSINASGQVTGYFDDSSGQHGFLATPVNPPTNTVPGTSYAASEDTALILTGLSVADPDSANLTTTLSVQHGTLTVDAVMGGATVTGNPDGSVTLAGSAAEVNASLGAVHYRASPDYNGPDTLTLATSDGALPTTNTVGIAVGAVNDAPTTANHIAQAVEDTPYIFTSADFPFADTSDAPANALANVIITALPATGTLFLDADRPGGNDPVAVTANQAIARADLDAGHLFYRPVANATGGVAFQFRVQDDGGGQDTSEAAMQTINLRAVNDAPVVAGGNTVPLTSMDEDTLPAGQTVRALFGSHFSDAADAVTGGSSANGLAGIAVTSAPNSPSADNGSGPAVMALGRLWRSRPAPTASCSIQMP